MIIVTGGVTARADSFAVLLEACLAHCARSRLEPGCLEHAVHVDCGNPFRLVFFKRWADAASLAGHLCTPDLAAFMADARGLAASADRTGSYEADPTPRELILAAG